MQEIISKVRDLINDRLLTDGEDSFEFITSKVFTLSYSDVDSTTLKVYRNGILKDASNYTFDDSTVKLTYTGTIVAGDIIEITYSYYSKYSNAEIKGYIRSALYNLSVEQYATFILVSEVLYAPLTGTIAVTKLSATVTGTNTSFLTELIVGDTIRIKAKSFTVLTIASDISLTLSDTYAGDTALKLIAYRIPTLAQQNLIAIISAILIKGNIRKYETPEITITFEEGMSVEKKIKQTLRQFKKAYGVMEYIDPTETWETD